MAIGPRHWGAVPVVARDPAELIARALAILAEESEAWKKRCAAEAERRLGRHPLGALARASPPADVPAEAES